MKSYPFFLSQYYKNEYSTKKKTIKKVPKKDGKNHLWVNFRESEKKKFTFRK